MRQFFLTWYYHQQIWVIKRKQKRSRSNMLISDIGCYQTHSILGRKIWSKDVYFLDLIGYYETTCIPFKVTKNIYRSLQAQYIQYYFFVVSHHDLFHHVLCLTLFTFTKLDSDPSLMSWHPGLASSHPHTGFILTINLPHFFVGAAGQVMVA